MDERQKERNYILDELRQNSISQTYFVRFYKFMINSKRIPTKDEINLTIDQYNKILKYFTKEKMIYDKTKINYENLAEFLESPDLEKLLTPFYSVN